MLKYRQKRLDYIYFLTCTHMWSKTSDQKSENYDKLTSRFHIFFIPYDRDLTIHIVKIR